MDEKQEDILEKCPAIKTRFEALCIARQDEIVDELLSTNEEYQLLTQQRARASQVVLNTLLTLSQSEQFEDYIEAVAKEELYRINVIYKEALLDAVEMLKELKIL